MKLASAFLIVLILAAACAFAQQTDQPDATPPNNGSATDQTAPSASAEPQTAPAPAQPNSQDPKNTTIRGCLEAGTDHNYTVTDKNGIRYTLTGMDANSLSSHAGEEVEAEGEPRGAVMLLPVPGHRQKSRQARPVRYLKLATCEK
jgi:hypothetical protein